MQTMQKRRDGGIDFARVLAMLAVIMIHVTSGYLDLPSSRTVLDRNLAYMLNQASRFSVPLFLFLSGVSLRQAEKHTPPERQISLLDARSFYVRHLPKLLFPYWLWSTIYFLFGRGFDLRTLGEDAYFRALLTGGAGPHLYFTVILFQCYLFYPLLGPWTLRHPLACLSVSFLSMYGTTQLMFFRKLGLNLIPAALSPYLGIILPMWAFPFVLGLALTPERLDALRRQTARSLLYPVVFLLCGVLCVLEARATGYLHTDRLSLFFYAWSAFPAALSLWARLGTLFRRLTAFLARHSGTVYYGHVLLLTLFRRRWAFPGTWGFLALYGAVVVSSVGASAALDALPAAFSRLRGISDGKKTKRGIP